MKIKVCGLKDFQNIRDISDAGADLVGLIFHKDSPRYLNGSLCFDEARQIRTEKVGVFVNESIYSILNAVAHYDLDYVQLHGNESPEDCRNLKPFVKVIKAFGIRKTLDIGKMKIYEEHVDLFLFDTATKEHGGSGISFDHKLLDKYDLETPFFLGGGISEDQAEHFKKLKLEKLLGLDINSKFESEPGIKNVQKVREFIQEIK